LGEGILTAGLNKPPLTLKKTHTFIARLNPNTREMYNSCSRFGPEEAVAVVDDRFAVWAPPKAKKRNKKVPTNSPNEATK
jgi:hypothetical protein